MSAFTQRRGPNVSQYVADLNAASPQDPQPEDPGLDPDDLALFTNTEFFDLDFGENTIEPPSLDFDPSQDGHGGRDRTAVTSNVNGDANDMSLNDDFGFPNLSYLASNSANGPGAISNCPPPAQPYGLPFDSPTTNYTIPAHPAPGEKRSAPSPNSPNAPSLEDSSRAAAEEDKRRRNTAASARFRVKKKQREQALEKTAKEMTDRAEKLERRIGVLEMENRWLRSLVVEKVAKEDDVPEPLRRIINEEARKTGAESEVKAELAGKA